MFGLISKKNAKDYILEGKRFAFIDGKERYHGVETSDDIKDIIHTISCIWENTFEKYAREYLGLGERKRFCFILPRCNDKSINGLNFSNVINTLSKKGCLNSDIDWSLDSISDFTVVWYYASKDYTAELEKVVKTPLPAAAVAPLLPTIEETNEGL